MNLYTNNLEISSLFLVFLNLYGWSATDKSIIGFGIQLSDIFHIYLVNMSKMRISSLYPAHFYRYHFHAYIFFISHATNLSNHLYTFLYIVAKTAFCR